jgi:hypothetical protein
VSIPARVRFWPLWAAGPGSRDLIGTSAYHFAAGPALVALEGELPPEQLSAARAAAAEARLDDLVEQALAAVAGAKGREPDAPDPAETGASPAWATRVSTVEWASVRECPPTADSVGERLGV